MKLTALLWTVALASASPYPSPQAVVVSQSGKLVYVALGGSQQIAVFDAVRGSVQKKIDIHAEATGLAFSRDESRLYITSTNSREDFLQVLSLPGNELIRRSLDTHGMRSPVVSPDGKKLYLCSRFDNSVLVLDAVSFRQLARIQISREPYAAAITPDGASLVVACHLPDEPSTAAYISANVCVVDTARARLRSCIQLANGSTGVRGIALSPDGRYAYVTHTLARYTLQTAQIEQGWINTNALSVIDVRAGKMLNAVLLDGVNDGAANPWAVACAPDGKYLYVTHAGTHEISIIDMPGLMTRLTHMPPELAESVPNDLGFLTSLRTRVKLDGEGPRAIAVAGSKAYVVEYFSGTLQRISPGPVASATSIETFPLGPAQQVTQERRGEMLFHDGTICLQHWQSCSSCHPDARTDALNWDLLNDGIGNPKNVKSLVLAHRTSPVMWSGVRASAEYAVRTGMKYILFTEPTESLAEPIFAYLKSLTPLPSPWLVNGKLSPAAEKGRTVFNTAGCPTCHTPPLYTDGKLHRFITPTLAEVWRTAPYFHDGRYATLREAIVQGDCAGHVSRLTPEQISELVQFVASL